MGRGERYNRRSIRLKGYDYTRDGAYFVTICTRSRERIFGAVVDSEMRLNECGREVARCWAWMVQQYPYVYLDKWIVMPDHTHAIIVIEDANRNGAAYEDSNATNANAADLNVTNSDEICRGGSRTAQPRAALGIGTSRQPTNGARVLPRQCKTLGRLIGAFETVSTRHVNDHKNTPGTPLWQRNYHESVVRNNASLRTLRRYIANNPVLWQP